MKWTEVEQYKPSTLPEENADVLCFVSHSSRYFVGRFSWELRDGEQRPMWYDDESTWVCVTHWALFDKVTPL
jgi:hypothetical protein